MKIYINQLKLLFKMVLLFTATSPMWLTVPARIRSYRIKVLVLLVLKREKDFGFSPLSFYTPVILWNAFFEKWTQTKHLCCWGIDALLFSQHSPTLSQGGGRLPVAVSILVMIKWSPVPTCSPDGFVHLACKRAFLDLWSRLLILEWSTMNCLHGTSLSRAKIKVGSIRHILNRALLPYIVYI